MRVLLIRLAATAAALAVLCATSACATETPSTSPSPAPTPTRTPTPTFVPTPTPTPALVERGDRIPPNAVKMTPDLDAHPPQLHSDEWKDPIPLPGPVNTAGAEDSPFVLPDGNTLYFFFTPDVTVPVEKQLIDGVTGIYVSTRKDGVWQEPERVVLNDDLSLDGCEFVQDDIMWFCSARAGYTGVNWFKARMQGGEWTQWEYAGDEFDPGYEVGELHFSADWNEVYFHSAREGGKGEYDIWASRKEGGEWQPPVNVEVVNTEVSDGWPFLSQDGRDLWFNRWYMGTPALFRSIRTSDGWGEPELIVSTFAGEPTLDDMGNLYFVHHFYKDGEMIEADIYYAERK